MSAQELLAGAGARIEAHRKAETTVRVLDSRGRPVSGAKLTLRQTRHAFLFGCNIFPLFDYQGEQHTQYANRFRALFNYATLGFYWGAYEPEKGRPQPERNRQSARWCQRNQIQTKGHPLVWHEVYPRWAPNSADEAIPLLKARIRNIITEFRGLIDRWDVVNEATVAHQFNNGVSDWVKRYGAAAMVLECLHTAREAHPSAILLYNDYNLSPELERLLEELIKRNAPLDAIGLQSHMHQGEWSLERVWQVCETYGRFGKPLHFTEVTILSGKHGWQLPRPWKSTAEGEARQAEYGEQFYTLLFSHPAVQAITWWDFPDGHWQGAPAGLLRADLSPKPLYERLHRLIKQQWWSEATLTTDAQGQARFKGFLGDYEITIQRGRTRQKETRTLTRPPQEWVLRLRSQA
ncbi:MAG: endo-1,4-beta-xylanase [Fimbriimonadales bacterium]|nr:endo-1,4-beta-xylanase [Fimbriimonadales bacterium]